MPQRRSFLGGIALAAGQGIALPGEYVITDPQVLQGDVLSSDVVDRIISRERSGSDDIIIASKLPIRSKETFQSTKGIVGYIRNLSFSHQPMYFLDGSLGSGAAIVRSPDIVVQVELHVTRMDSDGFDAFNHACAGTRPVRLTVDTV